MQKLPGVISDGQRVEARGEPWLVVGREPFDGCVLFTLRGAGGDNHGRVLRLLTPFDRVTAAHTSTRITRRSRRTVLRLAARAIARAHDWLEPWSALTAKLDVLPWQFEPAMAAVSGVTRLLLADEVGLGKTIQAGFIVAELRARGFVSRTLILTPASLRHQWAAELRDRFGLNALVLDHEVLIRMAAQLPVGVNPWATSEIVISSIDLVKRAEVRPALDAAPLDLLVVDEAHHLTPGSDRGAVVADLAGRTPWVVLATATPHSGDPEAYAFLSRMGSHDGSPFAWFRRSAREVGRRMGRHVHLHRVSPTSDERALLDETLAYATALWRRRDTTQSGAAMVASVICRRAASSSRALARTLARRRLLLGNGCVQMPSHPELPWLEEEDADGAAADPVLASSPLADSSAELAWLDRLCTMAEGLGRSSKIDAIARVLSRANEPAIVFSEYRDTLDEIDEQLSPQFTIALLHGGLASRDRREAIHAFVNGHARVLLASDAAGEGLNLQERCRLVVNVELPWNPMRLEQRIGRVDRLGQRRRVHAIHLCHRDWFEDRVLARLQSRLERASHDLRNATFDADAIASAVFDSTPVSARPSNPISRGTSSTVAARTAIAQVRRTVARLDSTGRRPQTAHGAACAALSSRQLVRGMALLFEWDVHDQLLRVVARQTACIKVTFAVGTRLQRAHVRRWTRALVSCRAVCDELQRVRSEGLREAGNETLATSCAVEQRLHAIDAALQASRPGLFQASLFDRRAEQKARATRACTVALRSHVATQLTSVRALNMLTSEAAARLVAAWALPVE